MSLAVFETTQPAASRFFSQAIKNNALAHAYILKGSTPDEMYRFALTIAQILNCKTPDIFGSACGLCQNCRWVLQNAHPAVMTVTRITYLEENPKTTAFTQIRVEQINQLLQQLGYSSEYARVVIFADAETMPATTPSTVIAPYEWQEAHQDTRKKEDSKQTFHIRPLFRRHFNESSANRFLKTLEEPPANTLFLFITEDEQNLLETIVSRCQLIRFASAPASDSECIMPEQMAFLEGSLLPAMRNPDCFRTAEAFKAFTEDQGLAPEQALEMLQRFLHRRFHQAPLASEESARQYIRTQRLLDETLRMIRSKVHADQSLNRLFYRIAQGSVV